jgi:hypothetical protein
MMDGPGDVYGQMADDDLLRRAETGGAGEMSLDEIINMPEGNPGARSVYDDIPPDTGLSVMATSKPGVEQEVMALFDDALKAGMSPAEAEQFVMEMYLRGQ